MRVSHFQVARVYTKERQVQILNASSKLFEGNIDFEAVLNQSPHVINLAQFLSESNDAKALTYAIEHFVSPQKYRDVNAVKHALLNAVAQIDEQINQQVNEIIHHPKLQKLEASWRGLWLLVRQANASQNIKIKVLNIKWSEVVKDLARAMEFDQSQLFKKIYNEEYGSAGGQPFGTIIGDYEVSHRISTEHPYDDIATLASLAQISAAAFSPFITNASSELFGMDDFSGLGLPLRLDKIFKSTDYIKWHALRQSLDTRFIGLTLPKTLMRLPYRTTPGSHKGIYFYESKDKSSALWGNACYAFAGVLLREFANVGWFGHIRGVPRDLNAGGLVKEFPQAQFDVDENDFSFKSITDVIVTDSAEKNISQQGFIPLCQGYLSPYATFYNNQSLHQVKQGNSLYNDTNAKLSAMLQHVLCGCRISHYIKLMVRDKVGSFASAQDCESQINRWLRNYTTGSENLDWDEQAKYPLKSADVRIKEHPSKPGVYLCVIQLQPHYQLDQMVSELELVTELATFKDK